MDDHDPPPMQLPTGLRAIKAEAEAARLRAILLNPWLGDVLREARPAIDEVLRECYWQAGTARLAAIDAILAMHQEERPAMPDADLVARARTILEAATHPAFVGLMRAYRDDAVVELAHLGPGDGPYATVVAELAAIDRVLALIEPEQSPEA